MAPKKKGGKKKGAKKAKEDWGEVAREKYSYVDVRNSAWASMRFVQVLSTSAKLDAVRDLIVEKHNVVGAQSLRLYLGASGSGVRRAPGNEALYLARSVQFFGCRPPPHWPVCAA